MKNLFYGENYLALNQAVTDIINSIEPNELKDVNFTKLDIVKTSYDDFVISTSAIPFMVNKRIIIVQNLISNIEKLKNNHSNNNQTNSWNNLPKLKSIAPEYFKDENKHSYISLWFCWAKNLFAKNHFRICLRSGDNSN